ncbi:MAG TPA: tetratricopeptide repeat protein [Oligoflexia bacterium]|nr:tetratricopeptide repeat protein [Oligoflexia bacterium]HMR25727.1 tetratricopeptide repeat protein [Oligoflexia bacterium]
MSFNRSKSIAKAQKLVQKGKYQDAIVEYEKVLDGDPNDIRSLMKIGDLYAKIKDINGAKRKYMKVASQYSQEGFFLKAVAVYKQILRLDPKAINLYSELAVLYEKLGLNGEAIKNYELAARAYEEAGDTKNSFDILRKIALINPDEVAYQLRLVEMYLQHGYMNEAKNYSYDIIRQIRLKGDEKKQMLIIQKLADLNLAEKEDICFLCELYLENSFYSKSLTELQKIFSQYSNDQVVLDLLALTFSKLNQTKKAKSIYKEIIRSLQERDPNHPDIEYYTRKLDQIEDINVADHSNYIDITGNENDIPSSNQDEQTFRRFKDDDNKLVEEVSTYFEYGLLEKAMSTIERVLDSADHPDAIKQKLLEVKERYLSHQIDEVTSEESKETTDIERKNSYLSNSRDDFADLLEEKEPDTSEFEFDDDLNISVNSDNSDNVEEKNSLLASFERDETVVMDENKFSVEYHSHQEQKNKDGDLLFDEDEVVEREVTSEMPIEEAEQKDMFDLHEALEEEIGKLDLELENFARTSHAKLYLEYDEVLAEFKKGVQKTIGQDDYETYYYLGVAYKEMNMLDDALECFNIAAKGDKYFYRSQNLIASCYVQSNALDKAVSIYQRCLKNVDSSSSDFLGLNYELGKIYFQMQQKVEAKACFEKVYEKNNQYRSIDYYIKALSSNDNSIDNDLDQFSSV